MDQQTAVKIAGERLWASLMDLARIGATEKGGNCRLALTALDGQGRDLVVGWMKDAGLEITIDQVGNVFGRRAGRDNARASVMTGSHLDTQPTGGRFDGCYGVLAGLEVMRTLNDRRIVTQAPLELAIWTNEEGSRFVPVMMGSGAFAKKFPLETALEARDAAGKRVADELEAIGYAGTAPVGGRPVGAYFEAHIEQGPILEQKGKVIGAVTGSLGLRWYDVTVTGMEMHAGSTPMAVRRDALFAATHLMQDVVHIANSHPPNGRGTVGAATIFPGSRNVIPGRVSFTVDLRHDDAVVLESMDAELRASCRRTEDRFRAEVALRDVQYFPPTRFNAELVALVRDCAKAAGFAPLDIVSGAGHDAVFMAAVAPAAMIFVPCKDGISHNEVEDASPEHLAAGCDVLLQAMLKAAS
jgi:beta-ureidopropionase / N-carbamoyl-L-amino-acid hydrolase